MLIKKRKKSFLPFAFFSSVGVIQFLQHWTGAAALKEEKRNNKNGTKTTLSLSSRQYFLMNAGSKDQQRFNGNSSELCFLSFQLQRIKPVFHIFLVIIKLQQMLACYGSMQTCKHLEILKPQGSKLHHKVVYIMAKAWKAKWKIAWNNNMKLSISATKCHHVLWESSMGHWVQNKSADNLGALNNLLQRATNARYINPSFHSAPQTFIQG